MLARVALAQVGLLLTSDPLQSGFAFTDELIEPVFTGATVQARVRGTPVDSRATGWAIVSPWAVTFESSN